MCTCCENIDLLYTSVYYWITQELREFLKRVEPVVCAALKRNEESRAFEGQLAHLTMWYAIVTSTRLWSVLGRRDNWYKLHIHSHQSCSECWGIDTRSIYIMGCLLSCEFYPPTSSTVLVSHGTVLGLSLLYGEFVVGATSTFSLIELLIYKYNSG